MPAILHVVYCCACQAQWICELRGILLSPPPISLSAGWRQCLQELGDKTGCRFKSLPQAVLPPLPIPGCVHSFVCLPRTPFKKCSRGGWRDGSVSKEFAVTVKTQVQILEPPVKPDTVVCTRHFRAAGRWGMGTGESPSNERMENGCVSGHTANLSSAYHFPHSMKCHSH